MLFISSGFAAFGYLLAPSASSRTLYDPLIFSICSRHELSTLADLKTEIGENYSVTRGSSSWMRDRQTRMVFSENANQEPSRFTSVYGLDFVRRYSIFSSIYDVLQLMRSETIRTYYLYNNR